MVEQRKPPAEVLRTISNANAAYPASHAAYPPPGARGGASNAPNNKKSAATAALFKKARDALKVRPPYKFLAQMERQPNSSKGAKRSPTLFS